MAARLASNGGSIQGSSPDWRMRERRVTAEHAAATGVHHASADRVVDLEAELVKSREQDNRTPAIPSLSLAWFAPGRKRN
jgi:hypothetical protein